MHIETISTGIKKRDEHLRSKDCFHVSLHPNADFEMTSLSPEKGDRVRLIRTLHIRDERLIIDTPVVVSPTGQAELCLEADFEVDHRAVGSESKRLSPPVRVRAALTLERIG